MPTQLGNFLDLLRLASLPLIVISIVAWLKPKPRGREDLTVIPTLILFT